VCAFIDLLRVDMEKIERLGLFYYQFIKEYEKKYPSFTNPLICLLMKLFSQITFYIILGEQPVQIRKNKGEGRKYYNIRASSHRIMI